MLAHVLGNLSVEATLSLGFGLVLLSTLEGVGDYVLCLEHA